MATKSFDLKDYLLNPDKYVFPFVIKEKTKDRTIITYNKGQYGSLLRKYHEKSLEWFNENIADRNEYSFAYHKGVRCADAIREHLKSNFFIKLDIHKFFESITEELFFQLYGDYFNKKITEMIKCCFYKGSLSIGFVTSPAISDYFMKGFDKKMARYVKDHPETHYSRYSDDILLSSEETDDDTSLNDLFALVKKELKALHLEINPKKLFKTKLSYQEHNSLSYLGLGISKLDDIDNKVTISKRYILFLLSLIKKNKKYGSKCKGLLDEINSRVAYLAYNSAVSYARFQKKHLNTFGEEYKFTPRKPLDRVQPIVSNELPDYGAYQKIFEFEIHDKISNTQKYGFTKLDAITIKKYIGNEEVVKIPKFVDSIGANAFHGSHVKEVVFEGNIKQIDSSAFCQCRFLEKIVLPDSLRYIGGSAFDNCISLKEISIPKRIKVISPFAFTYSGLQNITLPEGLKEIQGGAFASCESLKEISIPDGLEVLGEYAFRFCTNLARVKLPNGLLKIDKSAFTGCTKLKEIRLPDSLLELEDSVFNGCARLESVTLSDYVGNIGENVFDNCPLLKSIDTGNNRVFSMNQNNDLIETATGRLVWFRSKIIDSAIKDIPSKAFMGNNFKNIVIPEGIETIGEDAFKDCYLLQRIELPSSIKSIEAGAFQRCLSLKEVIIKGDIKTIPCRMLADCPKLERVVLPEGLLSIGEDAFANDQLLRDINIPHSVVKIDKHAFKYCYGIKNLYLSENAKKVHKKAFYGCSYSLESIKVSPSNSVYTSGQNSHTLVVRKTGELFLGCKNSFIEYNVNIIYNHAFVNCVGLKKIALPKSTTVIQKGAFQGCLDLEKVDLGNVYTIEANAFAGDEKITSIVLPESLTKLGEGAFVGTNIKSLRIPASLGNFVVNNKTFNLGVVEELYISSAMKQIVAAEDMHLPNLKKVVVDPDNHYYESTYNGKEINCVVSKEGDYNNRVIIYLGSANAKIINRDSSIEKEAFKGIKGLKTLHIGSEVHLDDGCFAECSGLKELTIDSSWGRSMPKKSFYGCTNLEKVTLNDVRFINVDVFRDCTSLKKVILPNTLEKIRAYAFAGCESLKEIVIPNSVKVIESGAFLNCSKLERVILPKGLKKIESLTFKGCTKLKEIVIPNSVESIDFEAFSNCKSLKEIVIPSKVKTIKYGLFLNCQSLEKVTLPKSLEIIEISAFNACHKLAAITLGDKIKAIGSSAFYDCKSLKEIVLPKKLERLESDVFQSCSALEKVTMGNNIKEIKTCAFQECKSLKEVVLSSALTTISNYAFINCIKLKEIVLPNKVKEIKACAFSNCSSLKKINIPDSVEFIDNGAFEKTAIETLSFGNKLNKLGSNVFLMCKNLKKVAFAKESKLEAIPSGTFHGCPQLSEVTLPNHLLAIGGHAFAECPKLKPVELPETLDSIHVGAFAFDTKIKEIYIPRDLTIFNNSAYYGCNIEKIKVHKSNKIFHVSNDNTLVVNRVGDLNIKSILYATKKSVIGQDIEYIMDYAFRDAYNNQTELVIPSNVEGVGDCAFAGWKELKHLSFLGDKEKYFGSQAFVDSPLENFVLPEKTKYIRSLAFVSVKPKALYLSKYVEQFSSDAFGVSNLSKIDVDKDNPKYTSLGSNILVKKESNTVILSCPNSRISEGVENISDLSNAERFDQVYIPQSLESINNGAFNKVLIDKFVINEKNPYYMTNDDSSALIKRGSLTLINYSKDCILPEGISAVGSIKLNKSAKKLYIPSTLKNITSVVALDTSNIEEIEVSKDNPYFDSRDNCNAIIDSKTNTLLLACKNTIIPESVKVIANNAYINRGIDRIYIPKHINFIGKYAFEEKKYISVEVSKDNPIFAMDNNGHDLIVNKNHNKGAGQIMKHFTLVSDPEPKSNGKQLCVLSGFEYDGLTKEERIALKGKGKAYEDNIYYYYGDYNDDLPF